jgi:hypothetical protein
MQKKLLVLGVLAALGLAGCERMAGRAFGILGAAGEDEKPLLSKPVVLGPKPLHLAPVEPLRVVGLTNNLCLRLSDSVAEGIAEEVAFKSAMHGAKLTAVLNTSDGKHFAWTCAGWMSGGSAGMNQLSACMRSECNDPSPQVGAQIASLDLSADQPLRILGASWESNSDFDHVMSPPPDTFAANSTEYRLLEKHFSGQPAWSTPMRTALQVELQMRATRGSSAYHSTLGLRLAKEGFQLEPLEGAHGMDLVTIPAQEVEACSASSFGPKAVTTKLFLRQGIQVGFLNDPSIVDWCWEHQVPMVSYHHASEWKYDGKPFPPRSHYARQFASKKDYYEQAERSAEGY